MVYKLIYRTSRELNGSGDWNENFLNYLDNKCLIQPNVEYNTYFKETHLKVNILQFYQYI